MFMDSLIFVSRPQSIRSSIEDSFLGLSMLQQTVYMTGYNFPCWRGIGKYCLHKDIFKKLKIPSVHQINELHINLFMFDLHNNNLPKSFNKLFTLNRNVHGHNTRSSSKLHLRDIIEQIGTILCKLKKELTTGTKLQKR